MLATVTALQTGDRFRWRGRWVTVIETERIDRYPRRPGVYVTIELGNDRRRLHYFTTERVEVETDAR